LRGRVCCCCECEWVLWFGLLWWGCVRCEVGFEVRVDVGGGGVEGHVEGLGKAN
jgi:hypothetical protein